MTDSHRSELHSGTDHSAQHQYEPPKLTIIGPLEKITLGSTGTKGDGKDSNQSK